MPYYTQFRKGVYKFIIRKSDYPYQSGIMKEIYLKGILEDLSFKVSFIKVPTILIWGDKDLSTPFDQAIFLHERIPHSTLVTIAGADHALNIRVPEELGKKILQHSAAV